jgi:hypothetical protein
VKFSRPGSLLAAAALVAAAAVAFVPTQLANADAPAPLTFAAASDYATDVFSDPWDYSNTDDINLTAGPKGGPAKGVALDKVAGGVLSFTAEKNQKGYVSPLWGGYPGSFLTGRDGGIATNEIDTTKYKYVRIHAWVSANLNASLQWFSCLKQDGSCIGGMPVYLTKGWNDFVAPLANEPKLGLKLQWTGKMVGLRFAFNPTTTTQVRIDSISVTAPDSIVTPTVGNQIWWTDGDPSGIQPVPSVVKANLPAGSSPVSGTINSEHASLISPSKKVQIGGPNDGQWDALTWYTDQSTTPIDISAFPPGSKFYSVPTGGGASAATLVAQIIGRPLPVVTSPSAAGCGDYAKQYLGHDWLKSKKDFTLTSAKLKSFKAGKVVTAVNAKFGPKSPKNDPHITFKLGPKGIDGTVWHRLTIVESYTGAFDLGSQAGGGTLGRVIWQKAGAKKVAQTNDLVEYAGKQAIVLDLNTNPKLLTEPEGPPSQRYTFKNKKITQLRFDPNEDKGSRVWSVYSVVLAKDCSTTSTFNVTWNDGNLMAGSTATVWATSTKGTVQLPIQNVNGIAVDPTLASSPVAEAAANTATVDVAPLKAFGKTSWTIQVQASNTTDPRNLPSIGNATGPLVVS